MNVALYPSKSNKRDGRLWADFGTQNLSLVFSTMESTAQFLAYTNLPKPLCCSTQSPPFFHSKTSVFASNSFTSLCYKSSQKKLQLIQLKAARLRNLRPVNVSDSGSPLSDDPEKWLLQPVGDGDSRHIGFRVPMPNAFEIASSMVTVGRLPEKADMVIPVATVSGLHARIQKKEGRLLVTDLDSTNGTFIDDKRLRPGAAATVSPGSCITFGDIHLAVFRVSKLQNVDFPSEQEESQIKSETDTPTDNPETAS
ncbi:hypothetical protein HHK36_017001 [Tetracentron sinense]|uniref:FHA domain-containing protein n=1 Tax=Tetracentron sinense TaxID=13715 RepID=A0A835DF85_TETSI|nr:hypothetical protein HHK36_017001 [Tetracentron sinense]